MKGYRYWAGVGVETNCETALNYYRKVASKGKELSVALKSSQVSKII